LSSFFNFSQLILLAVLILGIILILVFWKYKTLVILGFCILFLVLGIWRHQLAEIRSAKSEIRNLNDKNETITLIGIVSGQPAIREKTIKLKIENLKLKMNGEWNDISGAILVTTNRYPEYQYGDKLKITGKLETPPIFEGFNYKDYLKKEGIYSIMNFPKIELLGQNFGNPIYKTLFSFKNKFKETSRQFISPPQEGILEALVFGDEENISQEWKEKLNFTGTRHIAAVSGMNITIISFLILNFLLLLGFWRQQAFYFTIFLLVLYILMLGAPASAVRAGIMGGLLLLAQQLGRMSQAQRAVVFAATFMLFLNPLLLKLDIGFQLSFLAILGIIYLQPFFFDFLKKIPNPTFFPVRTTLSATLSAQIFTLPILVYNFGYIPLVSPITNILIVPFLAPITILIFIFGLAGMIFWLLGYIFSFPVWLFLTYIVKIIDWFSNPPFISLTIKNLHWFWLIISYLILAEFVRQLNKKQKLKFLDY